MAENAATSYGGNLRRAWRFARRQVLRHAILLLIAITLAAGFLGFQCARSDGDALDSLYRTVQLLALEYDELDPSQLRPGSSAAADGENVLIDLARFAGAATVFFAVVSLFMVRQRDRWKLWRQTWPWRARRRIVLLGFGAVNTAIARELGRHDVPITAVSDAFTESDREMARAHDIVLVAGNLTDAETLSKAAAGRCRHIVVAAGDDVTNVEIGTVAAAFAERHQAGLERRRGVLDAVREPLRGGRPEAGAKPDARPRNYGCNEKNKPVVKIHLSSTRTLADLTEARDIAYERGGAGEFVSIKAEVAHQLIREARFTQIARDRNQARVHVVIAGLGDQGEALLTEIFLNGFAATVEGGKAKALAAPRFTIIDNRPEAEIRERLRAHRPRLFDDTIPTEARPEIAFLSRDAMAIAFDADADIDRIERECPVTAWVFTCGRDNVNLAAGIRLEMAMHQLKREPAAIFIRLWSSEIAAGALSGAITLRPRSHLLHTRIFGSVSLLMPQATFLGDLAERELAAAAAFEDQERLAARLHAHYRGEAAKLDENGGRDPQDGAALDGPESRFMKEWKALPTAVRQANRRAIRHAATKLRDLGFDWPGSDGILLPQIDRDTASWLLAKVVPHVGAMATADLADARGQRWLEAIGLPAGKTSLARSAAEAKKLIAAIAKSEHSRWLADRAVEGWREGTRDNRRRRNPSIRNFGELDAIRELDLTVVRALLTDLSVATPGLDRPQAALRRVATIEVGEIDGTPRTDGMTDDVTELRVVVVRAEGAGAGMTEAQRDALDAAVQRWCVRARAPSRIRIVLKVPVEVDQSGFVDENRRRLGEWLTSLRAVTPRRVVVDVTHDYRRHDDAVAAPSRAAPKATRRRRAAEAGSA